MKIDIKSLLPDELAKALAELHEPKYRAKQIFSWLNRGAKSFDEMTNLSKELRQKLSESFHVTAPKPIETVVMSYKYGNTVCISSQVGCRQGCAFCASAIGGLVRNLLPSEMLDEVLFSQIDSGLEISNIVLMGIGEPLDNFDNV
ncbi:MAG: 23S rRNA (adenine(2503)-C(2))-methyltransferase RlmN, partial [Oscillospiraceae bacterium]